MLTSKPSVLCPAALPPLFELGASPAAKYRDCVSTKCWKCAQQDSQSSMVSLDMVSGAGFETLYTRAGEFRTLTFCNRGE